MLERMRSKQPGAALWSIVFYRCVAAGARWAMKLFWGLRAVHLERVPRVGPLVLVANHQSYLDPAAIGCLIKSRNLDYIARVGLFSFRPLGWLIGALNSIPIRGTGGADAGTIREVVARLSAGRGTLMFPEASRTHDGYLQPFQAGVMLLVRKAKCPVVPVAIAGAYRAWPRSRAVPRPWASRVRVMYGEPIPAQTLLALPAEAAVALLRARIAEMLVEMGEPVDHPIANPESREVEPAGGQPASAQP